MPDMPSPPGCVKYFVPGLPDWVTDEHLKEHFGQYGQVVAAAIVKDKGSENSRGFGYLTMVDVSSQPALLTNKHQFGDAVVQVLLTKDSLTGHDVKKVHLGKLSHDITGEALREVFSQFGLVLDVHTPKDPLTGERKNFGFVTFATDDAFAAAVQAATVPVGPSCVVTVKPAAQTSGGGAGPSKGPGKGGGAEWGPWGGGCGYGWGPKGGKDPWSAAWKGGKGCWGGDDSWGGAGSSAGGGAGGGSRTKRDGVKYFVPGLPETVTDSDLQRHFSQYGTVVDAAVVKEKGTETSRGFGYVTFADESNQAMVLGTKHLFGDRAISIMLTKDSLSGGNVKKVHLGQLPAHLTAESLREAFSNFGLVIDVHTPKDPKTGERKNFGFVTYAGDDSFNSVIAAGTVMVEGHAISVKPAAQSRENNDAGFPGSGKGAGKDGGKGMGKEAYWGGWDAWGMPSWGGWGGCDSWGSSYDPWGKGSGKWGGAKGYWDASGPYGGGGYDAKGSKGGFDGKGGPKGCGGCDAKGSCGAPGKGGCGGAEWGPGGAGWGGEGFDGCGKGGGKWGAGDGGWAAGAGAGGKDFAKGGGADAAWGAAGQGGCGAWPSSPSGMGGGMGGMGGMGGAAGGMGGMAGAMGGAEAAWGGGADPGAGAWAQGGAAKGGCAPMVGPGCWAGGGACAGGGQPGMVGPGCWAGVGPGCKGGCQPMAGPY